MQFEGGYKYPSGQIVLILTIIVFIITGSAWCVQPIGFFDILILFLTLEGTVLIASAFTPTGLIPPPKKFGGKIKWFWAQQGGVPVTYN